MYVHMYCQKYFQCTVPTYDCRKIVYSMIPVLSLRSIGGLFVGVQIYGYINIVHKDTCTYNRRVNSYST